MYFEPQSPDFDLFAATDDPAVAANDPRTVPDTAFYAESGAFVRKHSVLLSREEPSTYGLG